jgi:hypothetical protein
LSGTLSVPSMIPWSGSKVSESMRREVKSRQLRIQDFAPLQGGLSAAVEKSFFRLRMIQGAA